MNNIIEQYPNLYIPGAAKSGTSTIHSLLSQHPKISMSSIKEPHFWTNPNFDQYSENDIDNYLKLFSTNDKVIYRGESSTGYMIFPSFLERIKKTKTEGIKFIFVLRNPIDRIYSHYWWLKGIGSENSTLKKAILEDYKIEPKHNDRLPEANYKYYFQFGLYYKWLNFYYSSFDESNIKIITYESLKSKPLDTINECFHFLGLDNLDSIETIHKNKTQILRFPYIYKFAKLLVFNKLKTPYIIKKVTPKKVKTWLRKYLLGKVFKLTSTNKSYPKINKKDRLWLKDLYKSDVNQLRKLTGLSLEEWTDFNTY
jgi:hypothetical protein